MHTAHVKQDAGSRLIDLNYLTKSFGSREAADHYAEVMRSRGYIVTRTNW